jgi:hypothetical protein
MRGSRMGSLGGINRRLVVGRALIGAQREQRCADRSHLARKICPDACSYRIDGSGRWDVNTRSYIKPRRQGLVLPVATGLSESADNRAQLALRVGSSAASKVRESGAAPSNNDVPVLVEFMAQIAH